MSTVADANAWTRPSIVFHDQDGSELEVEVAEPVPWETRSGRWGAG